jgi:large subunit ribosomal protein L10
MIGRSSAIAHPINIHEEVTVTLRLEDKKEIVAAVNQVAAGAFSAVVADYRGLTVEQLTKLRTSARQQGVYLRVVRNTLARRAFEGTPFAILNDSLTGPTIIGLSTSENDMGAAARLFQDFAKDNKKLETALTMLASVLQAPISKFGRLFTALKEKQEEQAA